MDIFKKNERKRSRKTPHTTLTHERWVWNAIDVKSRYHLVSYVGTREKSAAVATLQRIRSITTGSPPIFITDGLLAYGQAIQTVYTSSKPPFNASILRESFVFGGMGHPLPVIPSDLRHLRIIKQRSQAHGSFTKFPTLKATKAGQDIDLQELISQIPAITCHTNYVERRNYTQRRRCACLQRKTSAVPQESKDLQAQVILERFVYNYCRSHRSLRETYRKSPQLWRQVTPAMKLGVTDHIWSLEKAFSILNKPRIHSKLSHQVPSTMQCHEPDLIMIKLKDEIDIKILQTLIKNPTQKLTRSELCRLTKLPRTTIYDRLCILISKTLVIENKNKNRKVGRAKIYYSCLWEHHSITQTQNYGPYILVSATHNK